MGENIGLFAAGVALSICISSFNSLGMGLQKKVHKSLSLGDEGTKKKYYQDRWVFDGRARPVWDRLQCAAANEGTHALPS